MPLKLRNFIEESGICIHLIAEYSPQKGKGRLFVHDFFVVCELIRVLYLTVTFFVGQSFCPEESWDCQLTL